MKILIVDDSRAMRRIVSRLIRQAGYSGHEVLEAENGREALEIVHADFPDLILADWRMPEMSGIELLEALNDEGYVIPYGFVTSEPPRPWCARPATTVPSSCWPSPSPPRTWPRCCRS